MDSVCLQICIAGSVFFGIVATWLCFGKCKGDVAMLVVCSIRDGAVGVFSPPMVFRAKGEAIRTFIDMLGQRELPLAKFPKDFVLFQLGVFDESTGKMDAFLTPEPLMTALDAVSVRESPPS